MTDLAIRVENLSKRYRIGQGARPRYETLYDKLAGAMAAPLRRWRDGGGKGRDRRPKTEDGSPGPPSPGSRPNDNYIWALRDVSFEVRRGEVVGIIGRNGAGKTTLLKILSRITEPTEGRAEVYGRVGSLLEVGTGFHPELTGRENIYLNGAILGMKKAEIDKKFDEIVAFAEIEKFIDTPVKFYSSGMYVRLAFAVAAHLEPEILLVDEVLAVGDAAFQKKCLGKMGQVAREGRTVLFVSHNMGAIQSLCDRAMWLNSGRVIVDGNTDKVVADYLSENSSAVARRGEAVFGPNTDRKGNGIARFIRARILNSRGEVVGHIPVGEDFAVEMEFVCNEKVKNPLFGIGIDNHLHQRVMSAHIYDTFEELPEARYGGKVKVYVRNPRLLPGLYFITIGLTQRGRENVDWIQHALSVEITPFPIYPTGRSPQPGSGVVYADSLWEYEYE